MSADSNDIGLGPYSGLPERLCEIADCSAPAYCKKMCRRHYTRAWRYGNPLTVLPMTEERSYVKLNEAKVLEIRDTQGKKGPSRSRSLRNTVCASRQYRRRRGRKIGVGQEKTKWKAPVMQGRGRGLSLQCQRGKDEAPLIFMVERKR